MKRIQTYEHYVVVIPANEVIQAANLLAKLGICLEGLVLEIPEDDNDPLFRVEPREIQEAHRALMDALDKNWLGYSKRSWFPVP